MAGLYVHIPFCAQKCIYCAFNSYAGKNELIAEYTKRVVSELYEYKPFDVETVYFGGGTPTYIPEGYIINILDSVFRYCNVSSDAEVTIEANPGTVTLNKLKKLKNAGFNRISIGFQSFDNSELRTLSRIHTAKQGVEAVNLAREAGFSNISGDIMTALPNQTLEALDKTIDKILDLELEHISAYSLTVEEGTPLYSSNLKEMLPDEDTERKMYHYVVERLKNAGYGHYEISNFAKKGFESRHNSSYWTGKEYVGLGAGAHSYYGGKRYSNAEKPELYINNAPRENIYIVDEEEKRKEHIFLGLRMMRGIRYEQNPKTDKMIAAGLLKLENGYISLTDRGIDISNYVFSELI
ncbi:MAG: radical SAM family heme chaperone HemW [Clostridia bacterium]|nr:radical SAM family heme chaperone HemW [Clostridia bacterium]